MESEAVLFFDGRVPRRQTFLVTIGEELVMGILKALPNPR